MKRYDPLVAPDPRLWLSLDETERLNLVTRYHKRFASELPSLKLHASIHTVVENQLAMQLAPVESALSRLLGEGLDRHEAIHAIGSRVAYLIHDIMQDSSAAIDPKQEYYDALDQLTAAKWRADD